MKIKGFRIILMLFTYIAFVKAHEENADRLEALEEVIEDLKSQQPDINVALNALEANLNRLVDEKVGTAGEKASKFERYKERLSALEEEVKYLKGFVDSENELDESLKRLSTNELNDVDEQIAKTKELTDTAKEEAKVSLGSAEVILQSVKNTADTRNFNLGGAIFYGGHGSACVEGADECQLERSECRAGQCLCEPGLSYDRKSQTCVETCDSYGDDFEIVSNWVIRGNNSAVFEDVSLKDCKQKCIEAEEFDCVTLEYFSWYRACYLSEITMLEAEDNWEYNAAGDHFQRNCH